MLETEFYAAKQTGGSLLLWTQKTSKYKGVYWNKHKNKYMSRITLNGKLMFIGYFNNETLAAQAYDEKAKELHGEYARLNFKQEGFNAII